MSLPKDDNSLWGGVACVGGSNVPETAKHRKERINKAIDEYAQKMDLTRVSIVIGAHKVKCEQCEHEQEHIEKEKGGIFFKHPDGRILSISVMNWKPGRQSTDIYSHWYTLGEHESVQLAQLS